MADIYTIEAVDHVTDPAKRVEAALRNVARAAIRTDNAMKSLDASERFVAKSVMQAARSELAAARGLQRLSAVTPKVDRSAQGLTKTGAFLATTFGNLAARGISMAVGGFIDLGRSAFGAADHVGKTRLALTGMLGSQEAANREMAWGTKFAKDYGMSIADVHDQQRKFAGLGFGEEERKALLLMSGDMRAVGMSTEQVSRSMLQISQIASKGKLQGEELIVLAENGISLTKVYDALGRRLGKTREEIIKMQKAGTLKSGDALNAIAESLVETGGSKKLGEAGKKAAAGTMGGVAGKIGATFEEALRDASAKAEPQLVAGLNSILKGLGAAEGVTLTDAITNALNKVGSILEEIGPKIPGFIASIDSLASSLATIVKWLNLASGASDGVKASAPGSGAGSVVGEFAGGMASGKSFGDAYVDAVSTTLTKTLGGGMLADMGAWIGGQITTGMQNGIANGAAGPATAATDMANGAIDAANAGAGVQSPSWKTAETGSMIDTGLAMGITADQELAFTAAREMTEGAVYASEAALRVPTSSSLAQSAGEKAGVATATATSTSGGRDVNVTLSIQLSGGAGGDVGAVKGYLETDFISLLERALEGSGA